MFCISRPQEIGEGGGSWDNGRWKDGRKGTGKNQGWMDEMKKDGDVGFMAHF